MVKRRIRRAISPPSSTLFAAPAPSQSRSRLYTHAHSQPLHHRLKRSQSRSRSPWTNDESGEEDTGSLSSFSEQPTIEVDYNYDIHNKIYKEPSHRRLHLQKVFDLLHLSIGRRDGVRAFRCLRILLKSHEWRPIELWRYALEVATLTGRHANEEDMLDDSTDFPALTKREQVARKRLAFLRELSKARTGLQLDVFIEIIPELLTLGEEEQALAEIDIVINQHPYRLEPILHLYSALLFLKLSAPSDELANTQLYYTLKGVSEVDQVIAAVPHNLLVLRERGDKTAQSILREAERKFETVLNVGRIGQKRGRSDAFSSRSRSRTLSQRRSEGRSGTRNRSTSKSRIKAENWRSGSESDGGEKDNDDDEDEDDDIVMNSEDEREEPQIEVGNDKWARNLARAYLEVLRAPFVAPARIQDSDEEM
ncbi:hypothetical protein CBS101457_002687 [Exobasidium rhododendri]|nr:hypothetical protein CBS101457_002687 [Exobasidium rhododendri]